MTDDERMSAMEKILKKEKRKRRKNKELLMGKKPKIIRPVDAGIGEQPDTFERLQVTRKIRMNSNKNVL